MTAPAGPALARLLTQIAEVATLAVRGYIASGRAEIAAPLQGFAAVAWHHAHGRDGPGPVRAEAARARRALAAVPGAREPRAFLGDVLELLTPPPPGHAARDAPAAAVDPVARTPDDLLPAVRRAGGAGSVRLADLRRLLGVPRLNADGRRRLRAELAARGLGVTPDPLPADGRRWVRMHVVDHPLGALVEGATRPGPRGDRLLGVRQVRVPPGA